MSAAAVDETPQFGQNLAPVVTEAETKADTEGTTNVSVFSFWWFVAPRSNAGISTNQTATMAAAVVVALVTAKTAATTKAGTTRAKVAGARTTETPDMEAAMVVAR